MYYRLWKRLYNFLEENDPENEILALMEIYEREQSEKELIEDLLNEFKA